MQVKDDFRKVNGNVRMFSRHYNKQATTDGATRLDRMYSSKNMISKTAKYIPAAISDHFLLEVCFDIHQSLKMLQPPKPKLPFKVRPRVIENPEFQNTIREKMKEWTVNREKYNHEILDWWECHVKPSIKRIAIDFTREMNKDNKEYLNSLYVKQTYFCRKMREGNVEAGLKYKTVNLEIINWFENEAKQLQIQINLKDITESENTNLYHHSIHK